MDENWTEGSTFRRANEKTALTDYQTDGQWHKLAWISMLKHIRLTQLTRLHADIGVFVELEHFPLGLLFVFFFLEFGEFSFLQIFFLSLLFRFVLIGHVGGVLSVRMTAVEKPLLLEVRVG